MSLISYLTTPSKYENQNHTNRTCEFQLTVWSRNISISQVTSRSEFESCIIDFQLSLKHKNCCTKQKTKKGFLHQFHLYLTL